MSNSRHGKPGGFKRVLRNRKRRIADRLRERVWSPRDAPMLTAGNIHYELADRIRGLGAGGLGALHLLARQSGLIDAIDDRLHLLKVHLPYHESDHVLNIAYNALCGGTCLEDLELRRNDEAYLDALGAQRIPDPTTAGDFCRRFAVTDIEALQDAINEVRVGVWRRQPTAFFAQATIDVDAALASTDGECKQGMGLAYNGTWGYHAGGTLRYPRLAGQHARAAFPQQSQRQPAVLRRRGGVHRPGDRVVSRGGLPARAAARRHGLFADAIPGWLGRAARRDVRVRSERDAQPDRAGQ